MKRFQVIAGLVIAIKNCIKSGNVEWEERHSESLFEIMKTAPSGSGIDMGTLVLVEASTPERLVFSTSFHHMNENGYYDGWTSHEIIVTPSLLFNFHLRVTGRDRNQIKEYLVDIFDEWLTAEESGQILFHPNVLETAGR